MNLDIYINEISMGWSYIGDSVAYRGANGWIDTIDGRQVQVLILPLDELSTDDPNKKYKKVTVYLEDM